MGKYGSEKVENKFHREKQNHDSTTTLYFSCIEFRKMKKIEYFPASDAPPEWFFIGNAWKIPNLYISHITDRTNDTR